MLHAGHANQLILRFVVSPTLAAIAAETGRFDAEPGPNRSYLIVVVPSDPNGRARHALLPVRNCLGSLFFVLFFGWFCACLPILSAILVAAFVDRIAAAAAE